MDKLPEWITAASGVITALGIGLLYWQLRADHNRSRRERAVEILGDWARQRSQANPLLVSAALSCTDEQAGLAYKREPIILHPNQFETFAAAFDLTIPPDAPTFILSKKHAIAIRAEAIKYLNVLEWALAARRHCVADANIVYEQFISFFDKETNKAILSGFRVAAGGERTFPSIAAFENELRTKSSRVARSEGPSG
jgi:hypothetical protein